MSLPFLNSPAQIIQQVLIALGLGVLPLTGVNQKSTWPIYATSEPNEPDNVITIKNTTPIDDGRSMPDGASDRHWGFQVRVRGVDEYVSPPKGYAIAVAMAEQVNQMSVTLAPPLSPAVYIVAAIDHILVIPLGKDAPNSKRSIYTINATAAIIRIS